MGRGRGKRAPVPTIPEDDDALLDAAIAENLRIKEERHEAATTTPATSGGKASTAEAQLPGAALTREEIIRKLNTVPTFCLANADKSIVGIENPKGGEMCCWFLDPAEAQAWLALAVKENPDVRGLHLGVTPLGIAFSFACGWAPVRAYRARFTIVQPNGPKLHAPIFWPSCGL